MSRPEESIARPVSFSKTIRLFQIFDVETTLSPVT
jgi:hypothetical protein